MLVFPRDEEPDGAGKVAAALGYRSTSSVTRAVARVESGNDDPRRTAGKLEEELR